MPLLHPSRRTTAAASLLALALLVPVGGPTQAAERLHRPGVPVTAVVPSKAPDRGHPKVPWFDVRGGVIHDGARDVAITPPLDTRLLEVWRTAGGYLARDSANAIYRVGPDGARTLLFADQFGDLEVEADGRRFALGFYDSATRTTSIDVVRVGDGVVEGRLPVDPAEFSDFLFDFRDGVVTFETPRAQGRNSTQLATWVVSGPAVGLGGRRLRDPQQVYVDNGVLARADAYGQVSLVPLVRGSDRRTWTVRADSFAALSPNGRRALTYVNSPGASTYLPGLLTVRDARTGRSQRRFSLSFDRALGWEDNRHLIVSAFDVRRKRSALLRLDVCRGTVQRVSDFGLNNLDRLVS